MNDEQKACATAEEDGRIAPELTELLNAIEVDYWVPSIRKPFDGLQELCDASRASNSPLYEPIATFTTNLRAAEQLLEFPYMLLAPYMLRGTSLHEEARKALGNNSAVDAIAETVLTQTLRSVRFHTKPEAQRLMHQALLLIWSALELYCKELFILSLNVRPGLFSNVQAVPALKQRFAISQDRWLPLLEQHDYDFNGCLGNIVAGDRDFSSPQLLRDLFGALYRGVSTRNGEGAELLDCFQDEAFWRLGQRRHLIAHKCAIVDEEYISKTEDSTQTVGQLLKLRGRDVGEAMSVSARCAVALIFWASRCMPDAEQ